MGARPGSFEVLGLLDIIFYRFGEFHRSLRRFVGIGANFPV